MSNYLPISVITPVYNSVRTIDESVLSVLGQTHLPLEYIIVDDASSDGTAQRLLELRTSHPDLLKIITHSENRGAGIARLTGLAQARGEWIAFLDGDDQWDPNYLFEMLTAVRAEEKARPWAVFCWSRIVDASGEPTPVVNNPTPGFYDLEKFFSGIFPPGNGSSWLFKRAIIEEVGTLKPWRLTQDVEFFLRALSRSQRPALCHGKVLVKRRVWHGSLMTKFQAERTANIFACFKEYLPLLPPAARQRVLANWASFWRAFGPSQWHRQAEVAGWALVINLPMSLFSGRVWKVLLRTLSFWDNFWKPILKRLLRR